MYLLSLVVVYLFFYFKRREISCITVEIEKLQSESNLLQDEIKEAESQKESFSSKIKRYQDLRRLIEGFISILSLDELVEILTIQVFQLLAQNEGVCLLYLLDETRQSLALIASKRERQEDIIKAKSGDIFGLIPKIISLFLILTVVNFGLPNIAIVLYLSWILSTQTGLRSMQRNR